MRSGASRPLGHPLHRVRLPARQPVHDPARPADVSVNPEREHAKSGKSSIEHAYGITSLSHAEASPERLLSLNRGHWAIENKNHRRSDTAFREDACLMRTGHGPRNNADLSDLALAIILSAGFDSVPAATDHFECHRDDALKHMLAKRSRKT